MPIPVSHAGLQGGGEPSRILEIPARQRALPQDLPEPFYQVQPGGPSRDRHEVETRKPGPAPITSWRTSLF